ncbi:MAG: bifunctional phosphoglucose/phosphomannose isomerase [Chloroflexi bacterium]|nr:bifunctional phosphoglucose/phosphomannose isomerase [Chloroflexota bacterium]MCI0786103.1 bifunctional phosphoglucose/phosphomannose isomerase [Chloroflexota bacterium]MCI0793710.1 bifunctional phosphoglucose/phosphomannose isomerase [Chloroflexota bacterium]MCI0857301.1 bifunctional phosphoglucose/phosphomannose isomerase [Chloroflexota bacterium]MCI0893838.1 bifunctional phosphoglucose/phosphomannose isomerase [Chloroflexota bacterium]
MPDIHDLDDPKTYSAIDPSGLGRRLTSLPDQCQAAWREVQFVTLPEHWTGSDQVIIAGMGGSAIAGDLAADLASLQGTLPVSVVRGFRLPFTPNGRTLVLACSYSGNTAETLSLFRQSVEAGAAVVAVTGGGDMAQQAQAAQIPVVPVNAPGEPRSAVGYNLMLVLGILNRLNLVSTTDQDVATAIGDLSRRVSSLEPGVPTSNNRAKQLALELQDRLPLVYGGGLFSGVARRWKTQLNENAKVWAFFESIPELLHNAVESYSASPILSQQLIAVVLQPAAGREETGQPYLVVAELLRRAGVEHRVLQGSEGPPLAQLLDMLLLGDLVSYYLAVLRGVDPSPTPTLNTAKELMAGF